MNRIATLPFHHGLERSMQRTQGRLSESMDRMASGRAVNSYTELASNAPRLLSAHASEAREQAYRESLQNVRTSLSLYDQRLGELAEIGTGLRQAMLAAIGTGQTQGFQTQLETAYAQFSSALNSREGGRYLFGGGNETEAPLHPATLSGLTAGSGFGSGPVRAGAPVADGEVMDYGIGAQEAGEELLAMFETLAAAGPYGATITDAQRIAMASAVDQAANGLADVATLNAANGRRQVRVDMLEQRSDARSLVLGDLISRHEDANMAELAADIASQRAMLEASYTVFRQVSQLSLVQFLR